MTLIEAQAVIQSGGLFADVYPQVPAKERPELRRWYCYDYDGPSDRRKLLPHSVSSGNPCKKCGAVMVWGGKCQYCPMGCGSEGECS